MNEFPPPPPPIPHWLPPAPPSGGVVVEPEPARPVATWHWWSALLVYLGGVLVAGLIAFPIVALLSGGTTEELLANIAAAVVPLSILVAWLSWRHKGWWPVIGFPKRARAAREIGVGALLGIPIYIFSIFIVAPVVVALLQRTQEAPIKGPEQLPQHITGPDVILAILATLVAAPIAEEFFFRGCLFRAIRAKRGFLVSALGSAFAFGLVHYAVGEPGNPMSWQTSWFLVPIMLVVGFLLAWVYERRGNIVAPMAAHAAFNTVGLLFILGVFE